MRVRLAGLFVAFTVSGAAIHAQTSGPTAPGPLMVQPLSDADLLSSEIRLLAVNPKNLAALLRAGELALKLDDDTAAAAFFTRAGQIDPRNPRVKVGEGVLLVAAERPGDALRHFAEAEALGADPRDFAADRALAYDLIGEQERAQRDYRLALRTAPTDETRRRYALSLGIAGKRELALAQIDALLRKSDRGAWRARAFILAMSGEKAGAEMIASTMMPEGMAKGLQPFFDLLPGLGPADRAFAVHFGEVHVTPDRLADARLVPPLAALGPDPTSPAAPEVVARPPVLADAGAKGRGGRKARGERARSGFVAVTTPPPPLPLPAPPRYMPASAERPSVEAAPAANPPPAPGVAPLTSRSAMVAAAAPPPSAVRGGVPVGASAPKPARGDRSIAALINPETNAPSESRADRAAPPASAPPARVRAARLPPGDAASADDNTKQTLADKKAADARKRVTEKKAAEKKAEAKKKDPKVLEPARVWVQVAGGANERDLPKQWAKVRAKAAKAFRGKPGWTSPLRATNRILTGPFPSEDDAQSFVNSIAKDGLSGFVFVSEAGQKITKLAAK